MPYLIPERSDIILKNLGKRQCILSVDSLKTIQGLIIEMENKQASLDDLNKNLENVLGVKAFKSKDKGYSLASKFHAMDKTARVRILPYISPCKMKRISK